MDFQKLYDMAHAAGMEAGTSVVPHPMYIRGYAPVMDGVCGFAWVNIKPGTSAFAKWLKANGKARRDEYYGGVTVWVGLFDQSMTRKEAYATAFAKVLRDNGIEKAYAASRMD